MRTAIYARKSTESEDRQVQSLEDQIRELRAVAAREGWVVAEIYEESRSAKAPNARPEFQRLVRDVEDGRIEGILSWSINRLSRNPVDGGVVAWLLQTGRLSFIRTAERTYRPEDNALLLSIENGMATAYLQDLSRSVRRGMRGKAERGWHVGKAPIGYLNDPLTKEIVPDPERFDLVRKGWDLLLGGERSMGEVHRRLVALGLTATSRRRTWGPVSRCCVDKIFRNRFYTGRVLYRGESLPGRHVPMVTEAEFEAVRERLREVARGGRARRPRFAFAGTFRCARCGCRVVGETRTKRYAATARTAVYTYYHCTGSKGCSKKGVREEALTGMVERTLGRIRLTPALAAWVDAALVESMGRDAATGAADAPALRSELSRQDGRMLRLTAMRMDEEISPGEFARERARLLERTEEIRRLLRRAENADASILALVRERLDLAVAAGELLGNGRDPFALGHAMASAGTQTIDLENARVELDPVIEKIAAFEPLGNGSQRTERGDLTPVSQSWLTFVEDLRTAASEMSRR